MKAEHQRRGNDTRCLVHGCNCKKFILDRIEPWKEKALDVSPKANTVVKKVKKILRYKIRDLNSNGVVVDPDIKCRRCGLVMKESVLIVHIRNKHKREKSR